LVVESGAEFNGTCHMVSSSESKAWTKKNH
jgi:hypothetical protein